MSKWLFHHLSEGKAHNVIENFVQIREKKIICTYLMLYIYIYIYYFVSYDIFVISSVLFILWFFMYSFQLTP